MEVSSSCGVQEGGSTCRYFLRSRKQENEVITKGFVRRLGVRYGSCKGPTLILYRKEIFPSTSSNESGESTRVEKMIDFFKHKIDEEGLIYIKHIRLVPT
jgi:hypothetical protein